MSTRTIVFSKNQALQEISGVPEDATVSLERSENGDVDLFVRQGGSPLAMIRNVESFTDKAMKIQKLKQKDWIDG